MNTCLKPSLLKPLDLNTARRFALFAQGFYTSFSSPDAVLNTLGYIQIDAISRVARAHHHVLWTRYPAHTPHTFNTLLSEGRAFEYWGHAASYLPLSDHPYYRTLMHSFAERSSWGQRQLAAVGHLLPEIRQRIVNEGPLQARHFKGQRKGSGWWQWKPAKIALELLYWQGELMVCAREGFEKVYDVRERFLPQSLQEAPLPSAAEVADFCVTRALQAHGLMTEKAIAQHLPLSSKAALKQALQRGLKAGKLLSGTVPDHSAPYYLQAAQWERFLASGYATDLPADLQNKPLRILSPFDNTVIQRERLAQLFGGNYRFEAYVPEAKRQYGYFTLPILDLGQGQVVALIEFKAERESGILKQLGFWPQAGWHKGLEPALAQHIQDFARFQKDH